MHLKVSLLVKLIKETTSMCVLIDIFLRLRHINIDLRGAARPSNLSPNVSKSFSLTSLNFLLKKKRVENVWKEIQLMTHTQKNSNDIYYLLLKLTVLPPARI